MNVVAAKEPSLLGALALDNDRQSFVHWQSANRVQSRAARPSGSLRRMSAVAVTPGAAGGVRSPRAPRARDRISAAVRVRDPDIVSPGGGVFEKSGSGVAPACSGTPTSRPARGTRTWTTGSLRSRRTWWNNI